MEFSRPEHWNGYPFPSPGDLPSPGIKARSLYCLALQANSLPAKPQGKPKNTGVWVAYPFSSRSSWPRNRTGRLLHCRQILYHPSHQGSQMHDWLHIYIWGVSLPGLMLWIRMHRHFISKLGPRSHSWCLHFSQACFCLSPIWSVKSVCSLCKYLFFFGSIPFSPLLLLFSLSVSLYMSVGFFVIVSDLRYKPSSSLLWHQSVFPKMHGLSHYLLVCNLSKTLLHLFIHLFISPSANIPISILC